MILAIVVFLGPNCPVATSAGREPFRTMEACQTFLVVSTPSLDLQRIQLQAATGAPVAYLTICHDMGLPA